jgi:hypothetical protein
MVRQLDGASWCGPSSAGGAAIDVALGVTSLAAWIICGSVSMLAVGLLLIAIGANRGITLTRGRPSALFALTFFPAASLTALAGGLQAMHGAHVVDPNPLGFAALAVAFWLQGTTVLADDSGAFAGLVVALAGATVPPMTGNTRYDAIGAMAVGLLLGVAAVTLAADPRDEQGTDVVDPGALGATPPLSRR